MTPSLIVLLVLAVVVLIIVAKTAVVVPQQNAYVVERLGRFSGTLGAGFHVSCRSWTSSGIASR